ncbi:WD40 repeat-like protein, partial [Viridothelium virens]
MFLNLGTTHALPSPSGTHIASLTSSQLHIRSSRSLSLTRSFSLHSSLGAGSRPSSRTALLLRWSSTSKRILVASAESICVYSLLDSKWRAHVSNGSGSMGRIINAEFGSDDDEVLMWTEFGASLTVWDLRTGKSIEIRDPKFHNSCDINNGEEGYGSAYKPERPRNISIFASLSRVGPRDILSIHAAQTYEVISSATLPSIDAKGLKWSPDGRWLTIWEAPSQGMRIWIYTADGHLFRSYTPNNAKDLEVAELGICSLEWSPSGEWLALGGFERRVTLLNTRTFAPLLHLDHTPHIHLPVSSLIYVETVPSSTTSKRSYSQASQPFTLPTAVSFTPSNRTNPSSMSAEAYSPSGISHLVFNPTSTLLATLSPAHPSTLWVWDLQHLAPRVVIVQSQPIKRISWAPNRPSLLLIQCRLPDPVVYLW